MSRLNYQLFPVKYMFYDISVRKQNVLEEFLLSTLNMCFLYRVSKIAN